MSFEWRFAAITVLAYLLGSVPFGYLIVRCRTGADVRSSGSGSMGATNVLRATGRIWGALTLLLDVFKGYAAVFLAAMVTQRDKHAMALAASAAVLGHVFPVYLRFRGGKGVATTVGVFLHITALPTLGVALISVAVVAAWRFVSLGSLIGSALFPLFYLFLDYRKDPSGSTLLAVVFCSSLIIVSHRENLSRIIAGTEHKLGRPRK